MKRSVLQDSIIQDGESIQLDKTSRRKVVKYMGLSGFGLASFKQAVSKVTGAEIDGVPMVVSRDLELNPKRIKSVSKERRRRLMVYKDINHRDYISNIPKMNGISITQQSDDPTDLALVFEFDKITRRARRKTPNEHNGMPVTIEKRPLTINGDNNAKECTEYDPIKGGVEISGSTQGSLCLAVEDTNQDGIFIYVTCEHIMTPDGIGEPGSEFVSQMYHPDEDDCSNAEVAADQDTLYVEEDYDVIAYEQDLSNYSASPPGTTVSEMADIEGAYTFQGVADITSLSDDSIPAEQSSAEFDLIENEAIETDKNDFVDYQIEYIRREAIGGCSGAPWVDASNNELVSMHNGYEGPDSDPYFDIGCVGNKVLETAQSVNP